MARRTRWVIYPTMKLHHITKHFIRSPLFLSFVSKHRRSHWTRECGHILHIILYTADSGNMKY